MTDISAPEEGPHVPDTVALLEAQAKRIAFLEALISETNTYYAECIDTREEFRARIAALEAALRPFAELDAHWAGDKMPLQPKSVMLNPLPILYAIKALKND